MLLILNLLTSRITTHTLRLLYIPQLASGSGLLWRLKIIKAEREVSGVRDRASGAPKNAGPRPHSPPHPPERAGAGHLF